MFFLGWSGGGATDVFASWHLPEVGCAPKIILERSLKEAPPKRGVIPNPGYAKRVFKDLAFCFQKFAQQ